VAEVDRLLAVQERSLEDRRAATEQCRISRRTLCDFAVAVVRVGRVVNVDPAMMATMHLSGSTNDDERLAYSRALLDRVSTAPTRSLTCSSPSRSTRRTRIPRS
jgi:hypothetical protein